MNTNNNSNRPEQGVAVGWFKKKKKKKVELRRLTLDFSSGGDLTARGFQSCVGLCADSVEPTWDFLSLSLSPNK